MTLLLALVTRRGVHLSADYRLTNDDGIVSDASTKIVQAQYFDWHGVVAYTGVGRVGQFNPRDTSEFLIEWLTGLHKASIEDVTERIRERGTAWLRSLRNRQRHTFLLAAVKDQRPIISLISNFEDIAARDDPIPAAELTVSTKTGGTFPWLVVAGQKHAVERPLRKRIIASAPPGSDDPQRARNALHLANEEIANSPASGGTVSRACSTLSIRVDGTGNYVPDGAVESHVLMNGAYLPLKDIIASIGGEPKQLVSSGFVGSGARLPFAECPRRRVNPEPGSAYEMQEIVIGGFKNIHPMALNDNGTVVGTCSPLGQSGARIIWIREPGLPPRQLETTCTPVAISHTGQIAVNVPTEGGKQQPAIVLGDEGTMLELGEWSYAGANDLDESGRVVGWVCVHPTETGRSHHRPAAWVNNEMVILENPDFDWGYASKINATGEVLVVGYRANICGAFRWNPSSGKCTEAAQFGPVPLDLGADGTILGCSRREIGRARVVLARPGADWELLGSPEGFYGQSLNDVGHVGGHIESTAGGRPCVFSAPDGLIQLPYYRDHHCQVSRLNAAGVAVGHAGTDHGTHALIWLPLDRSN